MNAVSVFGLPVSETMIDRLGWVFVHSLWQFTLVALLAAVVMRVLRRSSAEARSGALIGLLVLSIVFPIVTWMLQSSGPTIATARPEVRQESPSSNALPIVDQPIDTPIVNSTEQTAEVSEAVKAAPAPVFNTPVDIPPRSTWTEQATAILRPWLAWTVGFWGLGVVLCSLRPLMGWLTLRRLKRVGVAPASKEVLASLTRVSKRLGLDRSVQILESSIAQVPLVVGCLRPVILLPVSLLANIPATQLDAILAHELAHIRRHDFFVNLLQILIETLFFYHPAVWWLSHRIRVEREHCCDDLVVGVMENRGDYGRALIAIEELRGRSSVLALGASDGSLLARVCRIAGQPSERTGLSAGTAFCLLVCLVGAVLVMSFMGDSGVAAIDDTTSAEVEWGEAVNGLRMRVVPVHAEMSEEEVDLNAVQRKFKSQQEVAFAIEMENVSDKPIRILDTRYGNSYGEHSGKPNSNWFGQFLFSIEYFDADGRKVEYPHVAFVAPDLSGGSLISEIAPGGSHRFLIRPAKWSSVMYQRLKYRKYTALVHYHSLAKRAADRIRERKPTSETLNAWSGDVASVVTRFQIARPLIPPRTLSWGEPDNGLRAAMSFSPFLPWYGHGQKLDTLLHIQNVSDKPITLASEMSLSVASLTVKDAAGNPIKLGPTLLYEGVPTMIRTTLEPQQTIVLGAGSFGIAKTQEQADVFGHVTHGTMVVPTGEYRLQLTFESWRTPRMEDGKGRRLAPLDGDYVGNLTTGKKYLFLKDQPFDMSKEKVENASTPRQWAEIYVNQIQLRRNSDGTYPASVFDTLRKCLQKHAKSEEPGAEAWETAIDAKGTWTHEELLAHVLELAEWSFHIINIAYHDERNRQPMNTLTPGRMPAANELEGLPFGEAAEDGLRVAWVFDSEGSAQLGETVGGRMEFHNSGDGPVTFSVEPWGWTDWEARNQRGDKVKCRHIPLAFWIGTYVRYRLEPGQIAETIGEPLGFGELSEVDHTLATTWIPARPGDFLSVTGRVRLGQARSREGISVEGDFTEPLQIKERTFEITGVAGAEDGTESSSSGDARRSKLSGSAVETERADEPAPPASSID